MEKQTVHYVHPTALASSLTFGFFYSVCAVLVKAAPVQTISFFNSWFHGIDLTLVMSTRALTLGNFIIGLISIMVITYGAGALYAFLYNKCVDHCKKKGWM